MTAANKVRLYDLARELKLDSKRVIEDARREGADVSVPSNTISMEIAERIRNKYFPKKETTAARTVRVVKKAPKETTAAEETPIANETAPVSPPTIPASSNQAAAPAAQIAEPQTAQPRLVPRRIPLAPAKRAEKETAEVQARQPAADGERSAPAATAPAPPATTEADTSAPASVPNVTQTQLSEAHEARPSETPVPPPSAEPPPQVAPSATIVSPPPPKPAPSTPQIRKLNLTKAALSAGIRPGERVAVTPPATSPAARAERSAEKDQKERRGERSRRGGRERERHNGRTLIEFRIVAGETATPQTTYIPSPDARRRGSRNAKRGDVKRGGERGGRYEKDIVPPPRPVTLEARIAGAIGVKPGTELKPARLVEGATVKDFAEKLGITPKDVVTLLLQRGVFATINQPLNEDVARDLGKRFGFDVQFVPFEEMVAEEEFEELIATEADDIELPRAPVVTVMGHVDHGKTSLLDAIRQTDVAAGEAGGITQHIGAYSVNVPNPDDPTQRRRVVFLDTPGHEAFTMMRARGAKVTDVVVLVVAADDGVMPQTVEAIEHARAAHVPIVVAINKIDKPDANPERVKQELAMQGLQPVEWGGDTEMVPVSAKRKENLDTLLETILLTADILDLKASPTRRASGVVLEAKLDRGRGSVATVLVQQGTLRLHDPFIAGQVFGKVRAMFNDRGEPVTEAGPATPVEVLGLQGVAQAGDTFQVVDDIARAQGISEHRQQLARQSALLQTTKRGIEALGERETKELLVILKADVQGSVEVLRSTLTKLSTEKVKVNVIRSGVGAITESDVLLASATQASSSNSAVVIIGFNVRPETRAAELAKQEHVDIRLHSIIYKVEEEIRAAMIGMLEAIERERILGAAQVRETFRVPRAGTIAGCMVTNGIIRRTARARLIREGVVAWEGNIASLRRFKEDVGEVREGFECGIGLENFNDIKVGDTIEAYIIEKVAATEL
jgi:translation initiation factor IF-2